MKSDTQIREDVLAELKWEPSVCADSIGVMVQGGVVTLMGHVESYAEKCRAERAALRVGGVQGLAIEMEVQLPGLSKRYDADIARAAANVLAWLAPLPPDSVKVMVEGGQVTLFGGVSWEYQRQAAQDAVKDLMGVSGVIDQIVVKPPKTSGAIKADIEATLRRRAMSNAQHIGVEVKGESVTLSGVVANWSERERANNSAWGSPGVRQVYDNMTMA